MIVNLQEHITKQQKSNFIQEINEKHMQYRILENNQIEITNDILEIPLAFFMNHPSVLQILFPNQEHILTNKKYFHHPTTIPIDSLSIGDPNKIIVIAGPCAIENKSMTLTIASAIQKTGAHMLRGGAYKPRTSPYSFQGIQNEALQYMQLAKKQYHLPIVSELMSITELETFLQMVDIIQIGARNMQNFDLLKAVGKTKKPILLKRGMANTINEWLSAAEYIMSYGNPNVILCERGIRTFETATRNTLDLSVIPIIKEKTHLPIIIDPSHACGNYKYVESLSLAAVAAGADGLMIEVHNNPSCALSDGPQSLTCENFEKLVNKCQKVATAIGKTIL